MNEENERTRERAREEREGERERQNTEAAMIMHSTKLLSCCICAGFHSCVNLWLYACLIVCM